MRPADRAGAGMSRHRHGAVSTRRRAVEAAVAVLGAAGLISGCAAGEAATTSSSHGPSVAGQGDTYGALPTFLPTAALRPDSMLTGTVRRPAVTTEGDAVRAVVGTASVEVTVTGPVVPGEGLPHPPPATTCTWTVVLRHGNADIPIRVADFTAVDEQGNRYRPYFVPGTRRAPATLHPGQRASFELRAAMPTGEGSMRWSPAGHLLALWDFVVEND